MIAKMVLIGSPVPLIRIFASYNGWNFHSTVRAPGTIICAPATQISRFRHGLLLLKMAAMAYKKLKAV
jgi:hypothetical protein